MKIQWMSNAPWACTGYGNQTKLFTGRIKDLGHDVNILAFYGLEGGVLTWNGMHVLPRNKHPFGMDVLSAHASATGRDVIISLIDAWVIDAKMINKNIKWIPWFPIDSEPIPGPVAEAVRSAYKRIVFTKFAVKQLEDQGMDCYYVPHGVETDVFKPMDMMECRESQRLPKDKFIIGMVAANRDNPPRKAFYSHMQAFAEFKAKHDDAFLYLHTADGADNSFNTVNLHQFADFLGLEKDKDYMIGNQYKMTMGGYGDKDMVELYNSFDVHALVSMGEGFGIPILEAQSCGCPVIVGDWTAMSELCFSGYKVSKKDADPWYTNLGSYQYNPRAYAIRNEFEKMYKQRGNQAMRDKARKGALAYDADLITEKYWKPVLAEIEAEIEKEKSNQCKHEFIKVGLYNADGSISVPCKKCGAELVQKDGSEKIIIDGFKNPHGFKFHEPDGLEYIIMRELERDYNIPPIVEGQDNIAIDIGAHVGIVSMAMAKAGYIVTAYEPVKSNYDRLVKNIELNGLDGKILPINKAITEDGRDVIITENKDNSGGGDIYTFDGEKIKSTTLKDMTDLMMVIDLLKIDCEGAEYEILYNCDLTKIRAIRGEFHGSKAQELLDHVRAYVPDVIVTLQGVK